MFQKGDVVVLKSGGPKMTITGLPNEHSRGFFCEWFDENGALSRARFAGEALKRVDGDHVAAI